MTITSFLLLLAIAGICGTIGQSIAGYSRTGCVGSIALGFIGALLGSWLQRLFKLPEIFALHVGGERFPVIWSIIGSCVFVAVISMFTRRGRRE